MQSYDEGVSCVGRLALLFLPVTFLRDQFRDHGLPNIPVPEMIDRSNDEVE